MVAVHFIGVAPDQWGNALRVWGPPDFTHGRATWSCLGEIDRHDVVILGRNAFPVPRKWRRVRGAHQAGEDNGE